uniref:Uncharacterized protein n=1 Tax=Caenorhabditis tropicalis TaxID=1561998 RepID=A0A1I7UAE3_9PELO
MELKSQRNTIVNGCQFYCFQVKAIGDLLRFPANVPGWACGMFAAQLAPPPPMHNHLRDSSHLISSHLSGRP